MDFIEQSQKNINDKLDVLERKISKNFIEQSKKNTKKYNSSIKEIKEVLLDPEDGLIVRVNKNTYWRRQIDTRDIQELKSFKQNVTTALWGIYTLMLGVIAKLIFWK